MDKTSDSAYLSLKLYFMPCQKHAIRLLSSSIKCQNAPILQHWKENKHVLMVKMDVLKVCGLDFNFHKVPNVCGHGQIVKTLENDGNLM